MLGKILIMIDSLQMASPRPQPGGMQDVADLILAYKEAKKREEQAPHAAS